MKRTRRSAPAPQKILQRQCYDFGDQRYDRLARISVAQIYRLRKSAGYRKQRVVYQCTRAVQVAIGQRRAPHNPRGGRDTCGWTPCIRGIGTE